MVQGPIQGILVHGFGIDNIFNGTFYTIKPLQSSKKNTQGGAYIALERLESTYKSCNYVANICVYASQDAKQPIAVVIPHEVNLRHGLEKDSVVLKECNAIGKKNGFKPMEILQGRGGAVILTPEEWTPENGLVTAAQKIQRAKIKEVFADEIKNAYKDG
ncbi:hypothetical protein D9757_010780 [Collybiopsis confluens]|uniref:Uncharacterized protein n=1 Tax=Collybiopsis confluens TaxID=2823264 RepID=A0A8H5H8Q9_9AGAR|nr:hypothetical protein D9757_010780 [Collybiopsis confluens]